MSYINPVSLFENKNISFSKKTDVNKSSKHKKINWKQGLLIG